MEETRKPKVPPRYLQPSAAHRDQPFRRTPLYDDVWRRLPSASGAPCVILGHRGVTRMIAPRLPLVAALFASALCAAEGEVDKAALRLDLVAAKAPKPLAMEFRMRAAAALRERHPELADKFVEQTLTELRGAKDWVVGYGVVQELAKFTPSGTMSILPNLVPGYAQLVIGAL